MTKPKEFTDAEAEAFIRYLLKGTAKSPLETLIENMMNDKKTRESLISYLVLTDIGRKFLHTFLEMQKMRRTY